MHSKKFQTHGPGLHPCNINALGMCPPMSRDGWWQLKRRSWGHHQSVGLLIMTLDGVGHWFVPTHTDSLEIQHLLEWTSGKLFQGIIPRPSDQWGWHDVMKWLTELAQSKTLSQILGKLCFCTSRGRKGRVVSDSFLAVITISFCMPQIFIAQTLCKEHCGDNSEPGPVSNPVMDIYLDSWKAKRWCYGRFHLITFLQTILVYC